MIREPRTVLRPTVVTAFTVLVSAVATSAVLAGTAWPVSGSSAGLTSGGVVLTWLLLGLTAGYGLSGSV